jgi:uncharacterized protein (TIGR02145 family)
LINQFLRNLAYTPETVTYRILPFANGCPGDSTDIIVTVFPDADLSNPIKTDSICDSTTLVIALQSNVAGATFTWRAFSSSFQVSGYSSNTIPSTLINQFLRNLAYTPETVTYRILPFANGCPGDSTDIIVTVFPDADLANPIKTDSMCDSTTLVIPLQSNVAGTTFTWRAFSSSFQVSGYSSNTIPSTEINQFIRNTGFTTETITYRILPFANGCAGDSTDIIVTIFPTPDLSNTILAKEICNNNNTNILLTSNVTGTLFTWTCTPSSGNITNWSNSTVPTIQISQNLINTGNIPETVTYHITPQANGCYGWTYNYVVTVIPSPYLTNNPLYQYQCNVQNTNLDLLSNVAGTQFTWTCTQTSGQVTGFSPSSAPGTLIAQTLTNASFLIDSVVYHITPISSGCPGSVTDFPVRVYPTTDVYFNPNGQTICSGQTTGIQLLSHVPGTTFSWTTPINPNITGNHNDTGILIYDTLINLGVLIESVVYQVTPTAYGCPPGLTQSVAVTINPEPAIANPVRSSSVCNSGTTNIVLQSNLSYPTTYTWTAVGSSPQVTGYVSGAGPVITQTLFNSGYDIEWVTYHVTPTANGCAGDTGNFHVTVYPVADIFFVPPSQTLCSGQTTGLSLQSHVAGTTYVWTATGSSPQVNGYVPGSGDLIQQILNNTGTMVEGVTYQVTPTANGCTGTGNNTLVTVDPAPTVSLTQCFDIVTTTQGQPIRLKGGTPRNGVYSGNGVNAGIFYPGVAGAGVHWVTYTYTNTWGCIRQDSLSITVLTTVPFTCGNVLTDIRDNSSYPTVQIGNQCWMAANLNYGTVIPSSQVQRDNCVFEKYCYNDNPALCALSSVLYQWDEIMLYNDINGAQGFCPPEWHIPTEAEWNILFGVYISSGFAGSPLKYTGYSGFNALLNGVRFNNSIWSFSNFATLIWTSTSHGPKKAWSHGMNDPDPSVSLYASSKSNAYSMRCIKD